MKLARTLLAACALSGTLLGAPATQAQDEVIPFEQFTLPNGLRVVVHEDHSTPKVAVTVWYHVGSMNEPEGRSGFAHLYEHLMFNGSEHHDDEWFPPLQEIGASVVNGATSFDQTYYYEIIPTGGLERALWLESDRMGYMLGAITQDKLDEQRAVVQNEKRTHENQPYGQMDNMEMAAIFPPGHPYHHGVIGSMDDLNAASLDDVKSWFSEYYGAANAVVTLAGDVTVDRARELITKYFASIPAGPPTERVEQWVPTLDHDRRDTMLDDVPQVAISRDWVVPGRDAPESAALRMAGSVLGRGRDSRLYEVLVKEKQLATMATANYSPMSVAGVFSMTLRLKDGVSAAEAEAAAEEVLADYLANGPTEEELARAKTTSYADGVRAFESIYVRAMALSDGLTFENDPAAYAKSDQEFAEVTREQATTTARKWLDRPSYTLAVMPYGQHSVSAEQADRSAMPDLAPSPDLVLPALETTTLSNGIKVEFVRRPTTPLVEMAMVFDAGGAAEQGSKRGILGFTTGVMDAGPEKMTATQFAQRQADLGTRILSTGNSDKTSFYLSALSRELTGSIDLWADYIRHPGFRADDIERQRSAALSNLSQSLTNPDSIAERTYQYLLYGQDHAYGTTLAGRADALRAFTRADLEAFHQAWFRPENAKLFVAGDTSLAELKPILEKAFGDWKAPAAPAGSKTLATLPYHDKPRVVLVDRPGAIQSILRVGELTRSGLDDQWFQLSSMNDVLGGSFTSRLNMNLREDKGWTYGASSYLSGTRGEQSLTVATSVQTDQTAGALREIHRELTDIASGRPATTEELDLIRKGDLLALPGRLETNQSLVSYLQYIDRYDYSYDWLTGLADRYAQLSPEVVTRIAKAELRPDAMTWVVVGDLSKIEDKIRALNLGTVEVWDVEGNRIR